MLNLEPAPTSQQRASANCQSDNNCREVRLYFSTKNYSAYQEWKPKLIEGEPVTPEQFRAKLTELSQRLSMPNQQEQPRVSETSEIEELNNWLADPLLRKEVMPRVMKGDRYTLEFDDYGEPVRVVE